MPCYVVYQLLPNTAIYVGEGVKTGEQDRNLDPCSSSLEEVELGRQLFTSPLATLARKISQNPNCTVSMAATREAERPGDSENRREPPSKNVLAAGEDKKRPLSS